MRMYRKDKNKPDRDDPQVKDRKCLKCLKMFLSEWSGNRVCDQCKTRGDVCDINHKLGSFNRNGR